MKTKRAILGALMALVLLAGMAITCQARASQAVPDTNSQTPYGTVDVKRWKVRYPNGEEVATLRLQEAMEALGADWEELGTFDTDENGVITLPDTWDYKGAIRVEEVPQAGYASDLSEYEVNIDQTGMVITNLEQPMFTITKTDEEGKELEGALFEVYGRPTVEWNEQGELVLRKKFVSGAVSSDNPKVPESCPSPVVPGPAYPKSGGTQPQATSGGESTYNWNNLPAGFAIKNITLTMYDEITGEKVGELVIPSIPSGDEPLYAEAKVPYREGLFRVEETFEVEYYGEDQKQPGEAEVTGLNIGYPAATYFTIKKNNAGSLIVSDISADYLRRSFVAQEIPEMDENGNVIYYAYNENTGNYITNSATEEPEKIDSLVFRIMSGNSGTGYWYVWKYDEYYDYYDTEYFVDENGDRVSASTPVTQDLIGLFSYYGYRPYNGNGASIQPMAKAAQHYYVDAGTAACSFIRYNDPVIYDVVNDEDVLQFTNGLSIGTGNWGSEGLCPPKWK